MPEATSYRDWLIKCRHEAEQNYDKAVMTLSGGALGIAIGFLHGSAERNLELVWCLVASWVFFGLSLFSTLVSFRMSSRAYLRAIAQVDNQVDVDCIRREGPGGRYTRATEALNWAALVALLAGVIFVAIFVSRNIHRLG
jgi:hypothetical protein